MKKAQSIILVAILTLTMMFSLTGCGEDITLESQTIEGITIDVPSDFGEFKESNGLLQATNKDSTGSISISPAEAADGATPDMLDQDTYKEGQASGGYTVTEFVEFDNQATFDGFPALYSYSKGTNEKGIELEMYHFMIFYDDDTFQNIVIGFSVGENSSLEENIDAVLESITT